MTSKAFDNVFKLNSIVDAKAFGAKGDGIADDTAAINAAIASLPALVGATSTPARGGGAVYLPPGIYKLTDQITVTAGVHIIGAGEYATTVHQTGAAWAFHITGSFASISKMTIAGALTYAGASTALGGVKFDNVGGAIGWGLLRDLFIVNFTATGAIGVSLRECYRVKMEMCFVHICWTCLKFRGAVTTFQFDKGNVSVSNHNGTGGLAIDALSPNPPESTQQLEAYFNNVYFESCYGQRPIQIGLFGRVVFDQCGFEAMCVNEGYAGTVTDPAVIYIPASPLSVGPIKLFIRNSQFSGFYFKTASGQARQTFAGTCSFIETAPDLQQIDIDGLEYTTFDPDAAYPNPVELRIVKGRGQGGRVNLSGINLNTTGNTSRASLMRAVQFVDATYPPKNYYMQNVSVSSVTVSRETISQTPALDVHPEPTTNVPVAAVITAPGGANTVVYTYEFEKGTISGFRAIKLIAWGNRTGTAGNKQIVLKITDTGAATSYNATTVVTAADAWRTEITILFRYYQNQSINIQSLDGATAAQVRALGTKDAATYAYKIELEAQVANAADTMTLEGVILERV